MSRHTHLTSIALVFTAALTNATVVRADLMGHWNFDEGNGQVVFDSTIHGNHGVLGQTASVEAASDPVRAPGFLGAGSLVFDGASDLATVPDSVSLSVTGPLSVGAWVNVRIGSSGNRNILAKDSNNAYRYRLEGSNDQ